MMSLSVVVVGSDPNSAAPADSDNTILIAAVAGGAGGGLLLIAAIIACIVASRRRRAQRLPAESPSSTGFESARDEHSTYSSVFNVKYDYDDIDEVRETTVASYGDVNDVRK
jgi:hypothetical protein